MRMVAEDGGDLSGGVGAGLPQETMMVAEDGGDLSGGAGAGLPQETMMVAEAMPLGDKQFQRRERVPSGRQRRRLQTGWGKKQWVDSLVLLEKTTCGPSISKMCARAGKIFSGGIAGFAGEDDARAFDFQNAHLEEEDFQNIIGVISSLVR
ncbi:hypothetical protein ACLOJK_031698 [Asimina triloba]